MSSGEPDRVPVPSTTSDKTDFARWTAFLAGIGAIHFAIGWAIGAIDLHWKGFEPVDESNATVISRGLVFAAFVAFTLISYPARRLVHDSRVLTGRGLLQFVFFSFFVLLFIDKNGCLDATGTLGVILFWTAATALGSVVAEVVRILRDPTSGIAGLRGYHAVFVAFPLVIAVVAYALFVFPRLPGPFGGELKPAVVTYASDPREHRVTVIRATDNVVLLFDDKGKPRSESPETVHIEWLAVATLSEMTQRGYARFGDALKRSRGGRANQPPDSERVRGRAVPRKGTPSNRDANPRGRARTTK
jgi:hypothetical protein